MSSTLTWKNGGLGVHTGDTTSAYLLDLKTLIETHAGDAEFLWQVASFDNAGSPVTLVLKRKDLSVGRILILTYPSGVANNNPTIHDTAEYLNGVQCTYFPAGNVDSPSNIDSVSGTIMGDDTGALLLSGAQALSGFYNSPSYLPFYFDCDAGIVFGSQANFSASLVVLGAGDLVVDTSDNAYACCFNLGSFSTFGGASTPVTWSSTVYTTGVTSSRVNVDYDVLNSQYFFAFEMSGSWAAVAYASAASSVLIDTALNKAWFMPVPLVGHRKGEGLVLKLRQMAYGPSTGEAYATYDDGTGVQAIACQSYSSGGAGPMWFTNFKA